MKSHSLARAVDAGLPSLTSVDAALPKFTNLDESLPNVRSAAPAVDAGLPKVTQVDRGLPQSRNDKTNPFRPLTPRQLAAARLLAAGWTVADVADELVVSRQSIWKWRKHPAFTPALVGVHRELCRALQPRGQSA
jgi:hypothetical protein